MLSKVELQTIASLIENLDYYRILKIPSHAAESEVRNAFHREALLLHPDRYQPLNDPEALALSKKIYSKIVEAYRTLSSTERRLEYDRNAKIVSNANSRGGKSSEAFEDDNEITAVRRKEKPTTATAGVRFFKLAQTAFQSRDLNSAKMNIQIALNADPDNPEYLELHQRIEIEAQRKKGG